MAPRKAYTDPGTQGAFARMGIPAAQLAALLALDMLGALLRVHAPAGIFSDEGGYELVLVLAAGADVLALVGALAQQLPPTTLNNTNGDGHPQGRVAVAVRGLRHNLWLRPIRSGDAEPSEHGLNGVG
jgi:hypothetical protein